jgi:flagellar protein FlbD
LTPGPLHMIQVTRLNGSLFTLNALYIEKIESFPDTTITLTTGTKYVVLDTADVVNSRIIEFYKAVQLLSNPFIRGEEDEE